MTKIRILNRLSPCRCGCRGTDPQHKRAYKRAIRNMALCKPCWGIPTEYGRPPLRIDATGWARHPARDGKVLVGRHCLDNGFVIHWVYLEKIEPLGIEE